MALYAAWHEAVVMSVYTHRDRGLTAMVSRHSDGEFVARVAVGMGFGTARGSTTRGGVGAMRGMLDAARAGRGLAVTPDGPKGPRRVVQPGVVQLAGALGWPIIPVSYAVDRAWRVNSWDRLVVPKPLSRVSMHHGEPIRIPDQTSDEQVEALCRSLADSLDDGEAAAAKVLGVPTAGFV